VQLPALEDALDIALATGARDDKHSLLRLAQHHFVWRHRASAARNQCDIDTHADGALCRDFADRACEAGGAEVLNSLDRIRGDQLERGFEQELLEERVAHLD
jgi:hypothetical protein